MNKTVNMNIGGIFFHIDENAYTKLKHYLDAVHNSLLDDPQGKEEIIKDIEQRISELFSAKITKERQVINENDVDEVISIMGQPEDYQYDDEIFTEKKKSNSNSRNNGRPKKLYRSPKDGMLGGVASGLAYYFGMDVVWMRIIWIILIFPGGLSAWAYIILWLIVPEAKTTAEELEMKGEPVTIDNIEKKVKEEYTRIEDKIKNADYSNVKNGFQEMMDTLGQILQTLFKYVGKFVGVLLLVVASATLIGLIVALFTWGTMEFMGKADDVFSYPEFFDFSILPRWLLALALNLALLIPFIFLFILGLNIISEKKSSLGTTGNLSLIGVWFLALFTLAFAGIETGTQIANENFTSDFKQFDIKTKDTLYIQMSNNDLIANRKSLYRSSDMDETKDENGKEVLFSCNVNVDVRRSSDDKMMLKVIKTARGKNKDKAFEKANTLEYSYLIEKNRLDLNAYFLAPRNLKFSAPRIDIIIFVPENRMVYFDYTTEDFLNNIRNVQDIYDRDMINHYFLMESKGFNCTDCINSPEGDVDIDVDKNNGVNINIDNGKDKANVKIDENGIEVK